MGRRRGRPGAGGARIRLWGGGRRVARKQRPEPVPSHPAHRGRAGRDRQGAARHDVARPVGLAVDALGAHQRGRGVGRRRHPGTPALGGEGGGDGERVDGVRRRKRVPRVAAAGTELGEVQIDSAGIATLTATLPLGTNTITATYEGDEAFTGSVGSTDVLVKPVPSAIAAVMPTTDGSCSAIFTSVLAKTSV